MSEITAGQMGMKVHEQSAPFDRRKVVPKYLVDVMDDDLKDIMSRCHTSDRVITMLMVQLCRNTSKARRPATNRKKP